MRVVITGAAGFLASHLADRFLAAGDEVVGVDNYLTGRPANLAHLSGNPAFSFIEHDVSTPFEVAGSVQGVLHFASAASPPDYQRFPIETLLVGSEGTRNGLELARRKGARFFLASTSEVYGDPLVNPQPETYWGHVNSVGPRSMYDEAKRFAEAMTMAYHRTHGVDIRIVRIFNTYGPRMRPEDGRVVSNFLVQALRGQPLTVYGDGSQTRSFCDVRDTVVALDLLANCPDAWGEVVNVGNDQEISIRDLAHLIVQRAHSASQVHFVSYKVAYGEEFEDISHRRPVLGKLWALTGFEPDWCLNDTLDDLIERGCAKIQRVA